MESTDILDRWVRVRLEELVAEYSGGLDEFDFPRSTRAIRPFIEDLSTWYIRRSRDRFVEGDVAALQTLYDVLVKLAVTVAPTLPFTAEYIYRALTGSESVHMADYPEASSVTVSENGDLLLLTDQVRSLASAAHRLRADAGMSLRQPLESLAVHGYADLANRPEFIEILQDETNVGTILFEASNTDDWPSQQVEGGTVYLNTELNDELRQEGILREVIREIQNARKQSGLQVGEMAALSYKAKNEWATVIDSRQEEIVKQTGLSSISREPGETELDLELKLEKA